MRITVRRGHAQNDVRLTAAPRGRRRLPGLAAAALLLGLVAGIGVVPGFTGASFGAQVQADDGCIPILPDDCKAPDPVPAPEPAPEPPPKTTPTPTKPSPKPSVSAPKNKKKHHGHKQHKASVTATSATPSVTTSDPVVSAAFRAPSKSTAPHHTLKMFIPPVKVLSPTASATPVAAMQEPTRLVSAEARSGHGLFWFAFADTAAIALLLGGSLWRRRRFGPQW